ncbi:MAG: hypothetical protein WBG30_10705 [Psychrilyobacter sp.]|uniref:hypothetical protein n=1 Tax=Psychrilyobacter sp. TaxID=2586924 RepID=UPI003C7319D1
MKIIKSLEERDKIYIELCNLWKNSTDLKYKDLEEWQIKKYSEIIYKANYLRKKFSDDGTNELKGCNLKIEVLEHREGVLGVAKEDQKTMTHNQYDKLLKKLNREYSKPYKDLKKKLFEAMEEGDIKTILTIDQSIKTLERCRALGLKLNRIVDIDTYSRLELEALKLKELGKIVNDDTNIIS